MYSLFPCLAQLTKGTDDCWDRKPLEKVKILKELMVFVCVFLYYNLCDRLQATFHRVALENPYLQS